MRHRKRINKLSRSHTQRKALIRSLTRALFIYERIKTTPRKAKVVSSKAEELINLAKREDLHSKRIAYSFLQDHRLVKKLFEEIAPRFKDIPGGCTCIINLGHRKGDGAKISILELTKIEEKEKPKKAKVEEKEELPKEKHIPHHKEAPKKIIPPKAGLRQGLKKIFKKERDAL